MLFYCFIKICNSDTRFRVNLVRMNLTANTPIKYVAKKCEEQAIGSNRNLLKSLDVTVTL